MTIKNPWNQPFADDRQLPPEQWNPDSLFDDPLGPAQPQDTTPQAADWYMSACRHRPRLTRAEETELANRIQADPDDRQARDDLIGGNLALVGWVARQTMNLPHQRTDNGGDESDSDRRQYKGLYTNNLAGLSGKLLPLADRIEEGNIGLMRSAERYRPGGKAKFSTYALHNVERAITGAIAAYGEMSGAATTQTIREKAGAVRTAEAECYASGRTASISDIVARTGLSAEDVIFYRHRAYIHQAVSLETADSTIHDTIQLQDSDDDLPVSLADTLADPDEDIMSQLVELQLGQALDKVLETIRERESQVIVHRFGMHDHEPKTLQEIASILGVTRERVRQIESAAMTKLRHPARSGYLACFARDDDDEPITEKLAPAVDGLDDLSGRPGRQQYDRADVDRILARMAQDRPAEHSKLALAPAEKIGRLFTRTMRTLETQTATEAFDALPLVSDSLVEQAGELLQTEVMETVWDGTVMRHMRLAKNSDARGRISALYFNLANLVLADDEVLSLSIPAELDGVIPLIGYQADHGQIEIDGSAGDYCGNRMSGSGRVVINGNVGRMAGHKMSGEAVLDVSGSAGTSAGCGMRDKTALYIGGNAGKRLGTKAESGKIEVDGRAESTDFASYFNGTYLERGNEH